MLVGWGSTHWRLHFTLKFEAEENQREILMLAVAQSGISQKRKFLESKNEATVLL